MLYRTLILILLFSGLAAQSKFKDSDFRQNMIGNLYGGSYEVQPPASPIFEANFITNYRIQELIKQGTLKANNFGIAADTVRILMTPKSISSRVLIVIPFPVPTGRAFEVFEIDRMSINKKIKGTGWIAACKPIAVRSKNFSKESFDKYSAFLDYKYKDAFANVSYLEYDFPLSCLTQEDNLSIDFDTKTMTLYGRSFNRAGSKKINSKLKQSLRDPQ